MGRSEREQGAPRHSRGARRPSAQPRRPERTELPATKPVGWLGTQRGELYEWRQRYGEVNEHNGLREVALGAQAAVGPGTAPRGRWVEVGAAYREYRNDLY